MVINHFSKILFFGLLLLMGIGFVTLNGSCTLLSPSPTLIGRVVAQTYLSKKKEMSPKQIEALQIAWKSLKVVVEGNRPATLDSLLHASRSYSKFTGSLQGLAAEEIIRTLLKGIQKQVGFNALQQEERKKILKDLKEGIQRELANTNVLPNEPPFPLQGGESLIKK